ncbi:MAG: DUF2786 domain-containing protein [Myxococcota bacterium]
MDVLDRVKKLLALAGSPNVHEAALAAARAQALITRHRLEDALRAEAEAEAEAAAVSDGADVPLEAARKLRKWRLVLATALAEHNGCVAYTVDLGHEQQIRLAGHDADREAVRVLWDWLVERVQWASATAASERPRSRAWHDAFRIGAVEAVIERLRAGPEADLDAAALVVAERALARRAEAVERFVAERLGLKPGRGIRIDRRAYAAGRRAGQTLPLPE